MGATGSQTGRVIVGMLLGLSACVLLIACSNLANLVLARTLERSQELSVRTALGASLYQLVRPIALEALLLSFTGGLGALLVDSWCSNWLSAQAIASGGSAIQFPIDWRVISAALASSIATALVFGTAPALLVAKLNVNDTLKSGMRGATTGTGHRKMRSLLVVGQFAMAMTLLAGAAFLIRGANGMMRQHLGWDSTDVAVGQFNLPKARYDSSEKVLAFQRELGAKLRAIPGVGTRSRWPTPSPTTRRWGAVVPRRRSACPCQGPGANGHLRWHLPGLLQGERRPDSSRPRLHRRRHRSIRPGLDHK